MKIVSYPQTSKEAIPAILETIAFQWGIELEFVEWDGYADHLPKEPSIVLFSDTGRYDPDAIGFICSRCKHLLLCEDAIVNERGFMNQSEYVETVKKFCGAGFSTT